MIGYIGFRFITSLTRAVVNGSRNFADEYVHRSTRAVKIFTVVLLGVVSAVIWMTANPYIGFWVTLTAPAVVAVIWSVLERRTSRKEK